MRVCLVKIGEPLPGEGPRPRRITRLAVALTKAGHDVTWWTSDWSHQLKRPRSPSLVGDAAALGFTLKLLHAPAYRSNLSLSRVRHHRIFAEQLEVGLDASEKPDVIWACFPAMAPATMLGRWASANHVKLIYDIRDLSPDVFTSLVPRPLRGLAQLLLRPLSARAGRAFARADALVAVSDGYLKWAERLATAAGRLPPRREVFPLGYEQPEVRGERRVAMLAALAEKGFAANGRLKAVFAGTFGTSYDLETIIGAARLADARQVPVDFVIAGGGDAAPMVAAAASQIERLAFTGWLGPEELQVLLAESEFGLMAYSDGATQGLPNKIYEYMANGLVLLNSLTGEAARLIAARGMGVSYRAGSAEALLAAVEGLLADKTRRAEMAAASRACFSESDAIGRRDDAKVRFIEEIARQ